MYLIFKVGQLATETLLSLTSKRAGEWFKEEIRSLGGLDYIINTITECCRFIECHNISKNSWSETLLDKLRKVDRCLRVLENVCIAFYSLLFKLIFSLSYIFFF